MYNLEDLEGSLRARRRAHLDRARYEHKWAKLRKARRDERRRQRFARRKQR